MNATARNYDPDAAMDETVAHEPRPRRILQGDDMANKPSKAPQRYVYSSGDRPLDGYTIKRAIGRGGFGEVYYATSDAGKEIALKLITRNLEVERRGVVQCMNLKSPHLIAIHDLKQNDEGDTFVIMEYVNGPSLANILLQHPTGMPPEEIRMWLKGLVAGVAYLHDHGIVHRDLKPANLFLEDGVVKIGDYGLSKAITTASRNPEHSECVGTCHYMAPETSTGKYHKPIDVYAIGVILYEMVTGRVPFDGESVGEVLMKHLTSRPELSILPQPYKNIITRALAKDPNHRPARVTDLLLPGDAPREPEMRFLGDHKTAPTDEVKPEDDVLRIGAEESVIYIGPNTQPPRQPQPRRRGWAWPVGYRRPAPPPIRQAVYRPAPAPPPAARPAPPPKPAKPVKAVTPPPPPPAPVSLPSARVRVAELSTSMVMAAPVTALVSAFTLPLLVMSGVLPQQQDLMPPLAYLFVMTMMGTWGALVPAKLWEGRTLDGTGKRLVQLCIGMVVGVVGLALGLWTHLTPPESAWSAPALDDRVMTRLASYATPPTINAAAFVGYFGVAFALIGWWKLSDRARKSRIRVIVPTAWAALVGAGLGSIWPSPQPWATVVMVMIAVVTQLVSPWSKPAADYARWAARQPKRKAVA